jgi:hypothetical protein
MANHTSRITRFLCCTVLAAGVATLAGTSQAKDDNDKDDMRAKGFELAVLGGLPGMYGKISTDQGRSDVPIDTSDAMDEKNISALAILRLEVEDISVQASGEFIDLDSDREPAFVRVGDRGNPTVRAGTKPEAQLWFVDATVGYRVFNTPDRVLEPSAELYAGARYFDFSPEITFNSGSTKIGEIDRNDGWVDAIVGARINLGLSKTVDMQVEGDVGGFGLGASSDFSWMQMTSIGWSFTDYTRFYMAYKFQQFRRDRGDTNYKEQFRGPYAGLSVMF